ncbi:MAG: hypothetical protein ABR598_05360 [Candidatus Dormibacteria bacterium]
MSSNSIASGLTRDSLAFLAASAIALAGISATASLAHDAGNGQSSCKPAGQGQADGRCTDSSSTQGSTSTAPSGSGTAAGGSSTAAQPGPGSTPTSSGAATTANSSSSTNPGSTQGALISGPKAGNAANMGAPQVAAGNPAPAAGISAAQGDTGSAQSEPVQAAGGVLAASTAPALGIGETAALNGPVAAGAHQLLPSLGHQLDLTKAILILLWLALNAGFVLIRKRAASKGNADFRPISLGAWTYKSSTGL